MRDLNGVMFDEARMIKEGVFSFKKIRDFRGHRSYLLELKNAIIREGMENTQTNTVTAAEKTAKNG
jgi:hypothetical protein